MSVPLQVPRISLSGYKTDRNCSWKIKAINNVPTYASILHFYLTLPFWCVHQGKFEVEGSRNFEYLVCELNEENKTVSWLVALALNNEEYARGKTFLAKIPYLVAENCTVKFGFTETD